MELDRIRMDKESTLFESYVCRSAMEGGNRVFRREDMVDELKNEMNSINRQLELDNIDKELHDVYASRKEYVTVKHLHGYEMTMWTNNARIALLARTKHLVGHIVAEQVIDGILDWMHEGWYFGETKIETTIRGYVPSINKDNLIQTREDSVRHLPQAMEKIKMRRDAKKKGVVLDESKQGDYRTKAQPIEQNAQNQLIRLKVAREKNRHEHLLNETETTIRFGLFMLTYMYFRAMTYLSREKKSYGHDIVKSVGASRLFTDAASGASAGADGKNRHIGASTNGIGSETAERKKMNEQEINIELRHKKIVSATEKANTGQQRLVERRDKQRREALQKLQVVIKRQKLEKQAIADIQRVWRGWIGRKVARRWALKRAELAAMNALLNATANFIQRIWRGYLGRKEAIKQREEMAKFIALMRLEETQADEDLYWETHNLERMQKKRNDWFTRKILRKKSGPNQIEVMAEALKDHHERKLQAELQQQQKVAQDNLKEDRVGGKVIRKI